MKKNTSIYLSLLSLLLVSCDIINPSEEIPSYVTVQSTSLNTNIFTEGTNSNKITEVWLSVDGNFLGAYPIPSTFPIIQAGESEITFQAGIKDNGITSTPEIYPFYSIFTTTVNLEQEATIEINPDFIYRPDTKFAFIEDFEGGSQVFRDFALGSEEQFIISDEDPFEGNFSAKIVLDQNSPVVQVATASRYTDLVSINSSTVYLEVDYKSDVTVVFGVVGHFTGSTAEGQILLDPGFLPSQNWNKIYFNLSLLVSSLRLEEYQVVMLAAIPANPDGSLQLETANVWLDNIKLVHF
jgi:hypothetical protein